MSARGLVDWVRRPRLVRSRVASKSGSRRRRRRRLKIAVLLAAAVIIAAGAWHGYRDTAGEPSASLLEPWHQSRRIVDRRGRLLRDIPSSLGLRGSAIQLPLMGDRLVVATLLSEDARFYQHSGVDLRAIVRATWQNLRHLRIVSGASTISQQLVKLLDASGKLGGPRSVAIKVREAARAKNLEEKLSKREILEAYINRLSYGRGLVGPIAAARAYFGVEPHQLSWAQAAFLAVLPRAPSALDPYRHPERGRRRQQQLLAALHSEGVLDDAALRRARAEPLSLLPIRASFEAPHFVESIRARKSLTGQTVQTTLDLALQHEVEGLLAAHRSRLQDNGADNVAALVADNDSGEVLAYAGSVDFDDPLISGQVDMIRAKRQPGSTLKPFAYALAFAAGLEPAHMLADVPTAFNELGGVYAPVNFDRVFHGPISAREALAGSLNVPAVRLAAELPGGALLSLLRQVGMRSLDREASYYGLSLVLGSGEVSLWELAEGYVSLARGGEHLPLRSVVAAADLGAPRDGQQRIEPQVAAAISDTLSDPLARVRGLGGQGPFDLGFPVAVKTGTSSGYRDSWTVGYTRELTVAVWVGNANGEATRKLTGGSGAGPIFADIMREAMRHAPEHRPLWPKGTLTQIRVCPLSGHPAGPACPDTVVRRAMRSAHRSGAAQRPDDSGSCPLHRRLSGHPPRCSAAGRTAVLLPDVFTAWLRAQPNGAPGRDAFGHAWLLGSEVPGCREPATTAAAAPLRTRALLRISEPRADSVVLLSRQRAAQEQGVSLAATWSGARAKQRLQFVLDGEVVATLAPPYRVTVPIKRGDHTLLVRPEEASLALLLPQTHFSVR